MWVTDTICVPISEIPGYADSTKKHQAWAIISMQRPSYTLLNALQYEATVELWWRPVSELLIAENPSETLRFGRLTKIVPHVEIEFTQKFLLNLWLIQNRPRSEKFANSLVLITPQTNGVLPSEHEFNAFAIVRAMLFWEQLGKARKSTMALLSFTAFVFCRIFFSCL